MCLCCATEHHSHMRTNFVFHIRFEDEKVCHDIRGVDFYHQRDDTLSTWFVSSGSYFALYSEQKGRKEGSQPRSKTYLSCLPKPMSGFFILSFPSIQQPPHRSHLRAYAYALVSRRMWLAHHNVKGNDILNQCATLHNVCGTSPEGARQTRDDVGFWSTKSKGLH